MFYFVVIFRLAWCSTPVVNAANLIPSVDLELARQNNGDNKVDYDGPKSWKYITKHWPIVSQPLALLMICILLWALCRVLLPNYATTEAVPMRMAVLFIGAQIFGDIFKMIKLPEMLGMLGFGVVFTNTGFGDFTGYNSLEIILRDVALVNIMLLAGLNIELAALVQHSSVVLRLSILPTVAEVLVITLIAKWTLDMSWMWGILLGLVITAVSPNVVVDVVLWLKNERLGFYKGIHTIIVAVTAGNDVLSIFCFGVVLSAIISTGPITEKLLQGPIGVAIGVVFGFVFGLIVSIILPSSHAKFSNSLRFGLMLLGGLLSVIGSKAIGFPSAGAIGCIVIACMCGLVWKKPKYTRDNDVYERLALLWKFVKPISFALIGKEVLFSKIDPKILAYGVVIVVVGSFVRLLVAYVSAYGSDFNWKEQLYITISGFPKATVQATLGPVALDMVRQQHLGTYEEEMANNVLITSVLAILITAPLGAILMVNLAPKFLRKSDIPPTSP